MWGITEGFLLERHSQPLKGDFDGKRGNTRKFCKVIMTESSQFQGGEHIGSAFFFDLAREDRPKPERLISSPRDNGLSWGVHGQEKHSTRMSRQSRHLLKRWVLPNDDFVVGVPMGADNLFGVFREHQITHLRSGIDAVYKWIVKRIPKFDSFVCRAASTGEDPVVVRTPGQPLHCGTMVTKFADWSRTMRTPYV